jgi:signal transduction histidine kinase
LSKLHKQQHGSADKPVPKISINKVQETGIIRGTFPLEYIPVPCCNVDSAMVINDCNSIFARLLGEPKDRLIQASLLDFVDHSSLQVMEQISQSSVEEVDDDNLALPGSIRSQIVWFSRNNNHDNNNKVIFPCSVRIKSIRNNLGIVTNHLVVIVDETNNRKTVQLLESDRDKLRRKEKLQDEFISIASHELRTPIQPILGYAYLARKGKLNNEKAWDGVLEEARRLQQLANDILDVSRIESGTLTYNMHKEKINQLLESILESARSELKNQDLALLFKCEEVEKDLEIEIDRHRMTQAVSNILTNAIKFTDKGAIRVESNVFHDQNKLEIRISDTGQGIDDVILPKLFEKFVTKGHNDVENKQGTGLGLYICKNIVKAHGGQLFAFNNMEGGATFVMELPISQDQKRKDNLG